MTQATDQRRERLPILLTATILLFAAVSAVVGQENQRSALQVTTDEDGDVAVVMDTESIRMTVLPAYQGCISSLVYKPTGNDILARQTVKFLQGGSGLLQDNFWEQDWRFSEFRHKWYNYKIVSRGPDELAVKFWTTSVGWLQANESGVISDLISNIRIERTIRMPAGKPYFMADIVLSIDMSKDDDGSAKLPQFWTHNSSLFTDDLSDEMQRPHVLGIAEETPRGKTVCGDYVYAKDIAEGWSAHTSPRTKEGLVYLMDPAYVQSLYNCGNTTLEWFGDNMLITKDRPLKTRIYILPVIGLDKVHFADPHMILRLTPQLIEDGPNQGGVKLRFSVSPSYRQVKKITFETKATYGLHERAPQTIPMTAPLPVVRNLRVEAPRHATGIVKRPDGVAFTSQTPLQFDITAHIEMVDPNGRLKTKKVEFQHFFLSGYPTRKNSHLQGGEPLARLDPVDARPWLPTPDRELDVNRQDFRVFTLMGQHGRHYQLPTAIGNVRMQNGHEAIWSPTQDAGYSVGYPTSQTGLSNFPYDYKRLFNYRVLVNCNTQTDVTRLVGQSILAGYLRRGGGYVSFGGESAYTVPAPRGHLLNVFDPVVFRQRSIEIAEPGKPATLVVTAPDHPIFKGSGKHAKPISLQKLPAALSWHNLELKTPTMKPLLPNPNEPIALSLSAMPAADRKAVMGIPAARRPTRNAAAAAIFAQLSPDAQQHLVATSKEVFKDLPGAPVTDGVFNPKLRNQVKDEYFIDIREAFINYGDDQKEIVNRWLTANLARPNVVRVNILSAELRDDGVLAALRRARKSKAKFIIDGDLLIVGDGIRAELASLLTVDLDELPLTARTRVLMEIHTPDGRKLPFLVETVAKKPAPNDPGQLLDDPAVGRSIAFLNSPFGDPRKFPGKTPYWAWDQWPQLVANAIMYAGREL